MQGNISLEKSARQKPFDWLPEQGWEDVIKLTTVLPDVFGSVADDVERNERSWREVTLFNAHYLQYVFIYQKLVLFQECIPYIYLYVRMLLLMHMYMLRSNNMDFM